MLVSGLTGMHFVVFEVHTSWKTGLMRNSYKHKHCLGALGCLGPWKHEQIRYSYPNSGLGHDPMIPDRPGSLRTITPHNSHSTIIHQLHPNMFGVGKYMFRWRPMQWIMTYFYQKISNEQLVHPKNDACQWVIQLVCETNANTSKKRCSSNYQWTKL